MDVSRNGVNPGSPAGGGRRYGGVAPQERQRQRRERFIVAALAVFGDKGYHAATVRDVCGQAQLTSRYFYESFGSMEALFRAVFAEVSRQLMETTVGALAQCPSEPDKLAEAALRTFLEFIREDTRRARVMLIDALNVGQGMYWLTNQANQDFSQLTGDLMQQFFPTLADSGLDARVMADGLVGACNRIATQWVAARCETPLDEILRNCLALFSACIAYARNLQDGDAHR